MLICIFRKQKKERRKEKNQCNTQLDCEIGKKRHPKQDPKRMNENNSLFSISNSNY